MKGAQSLRTRDFSRILYGAPTTCTSTIFVRPVGRKVVRVIRIRNARRGHKRQLDIKYDSTRPPAAVGQASRPGEVARGRVAAVDSGRAALSSFIDISLFNERRASNTELTGTNARKKSHYTRA